MISFNKEQPINK